MRPIFITTGSMCSIPRSIRLRCLAVSPMREFQPLCTVRDLATREFKGQLRTVRGEPIEIDGLWGILFGNGVAAQPANTLFFSAGPDDEAHRLYGRIDAVPGR